MLVELDKKGLISLVKGTEPNFSVFENPVVKKCGEYRGSHDEWKWKTYELEHLSEAELFLLYKICKLSW